MKPPPVTMNRRKLNASLVVGSSSLRELVELLLDFLDGVAVLQDVLPKGEPLFESHLAIAVHINLVEHRRGIDLGEVLPPV